MTHKKIRLTPHQIEAIERALEHYRDTHAYWRNPVFVLHMERLIEHVRSHKDER